MSLSLDFCSREAATWATKAHHYSRSMPAGRLVCVGAWEVGAFVGAVVFGRGASSEIASPFGLDQSEVCELCRVSLGPHATQTSRIVSIAVRLLRRHSPGLRLVVSYADPEHGHHGGIYAAMNWLFIGCTKAESLIRLNGRLRHPRTVASRYRTRGIGWLREHVAADAAHVRTLPKFRYALPLDTGMRDQLAPRMRPYPKALLLNATEAQRSGARGPLADGGPTPIRATQLAPAHAPERMTQENTTMKGTRTTEMATAFAARVMALSKGRTMRDAVNLATAQDAEGAEAYRLAGVGAEATDDTPAPIQLSAHAGESFDALALRYANERGVSVRQAVHEVSLARPDLVAARE